LHAGDVVEVDFGIPIGSEAGFLRPSVVMTASAVLARNPRVVQVVPITSNTARAMPTEIPLEGRYPDRSSVAQTHLLTTISTERLTGNTFGAVSQAERAQLRQVISDLLDLW
jgi:mRNA-degrading endonuclease toxin of MazEF toxin-antitoxin module